ncbi:nitrate- and nitrite sensing domain-containing protein [Micromonospora sp. NPDC050495]|uniref:sensor histidine kinase n=1 Tax=Micromonospora sp. NPDC050495 TaxID=3154936 RepID=UPI0033CA8423
MLLGRLRIRGKLALLVIIPLLGVVGLAVPVVIDRVTAAQRAADTAETVRVASRVGSLVQDLQQERLLSVGLLLGRVNRTELIQKSAAVDDRVADLRAEPLPAAVRDSLGGVRRLADVRTATLAGRSTPQQILTVFGQVDTALIDALRLPFQVDTDTAAGRQVLALDSLLRVDEALSSCTTLIVLVKATGDPQVARSFVACMAGLNVDNRRFRQLITPEQLKVAELDDAAVAARTSPTFLVDSLRDPDEAIAPVPLDVLFPSARSMITLGQFVEKKVVADVIAETRARERAALTAAWLVSLAAAAILLVVVLLSMTVARTVARPLSRLTRSAERVARVTEAELTRVADDESETVPPVRLDPVEVSARDEIGDLARAFDRVQHTAARLVERQVAGRRNVAQMFGHVGRRTQNLVGRQIALIDRLERQETDPGRLEHLYRLDHISSRLRRNAGSLVVLSGATGSDGHVAPVPLADAVRLALGEIEDYTRVDVKVPPGVAAAPAIVGDLVLTLAELMENATVFSPPHTRVVVTGELTDGGARLVVVDHGIGLTGDRMAEENTRFTRRERLDLAPTEVLGLFVVGRLARRHGWSARLSPTPGGGVTAALEIPRASLVIRRPEPVGVSAGRAAVPGARESDPPAVEASGGFDAELLSRATRSMSSGHPWNAFGHQADTAEPAEDPGPAASGPPSAWAAPATRPAGPAARPGPVSPPTPVVGPAPAAPPAAGLATGPTLTPPATRPTLAPPTRPAPAPAIVPPPGPALTPPPGGAHPPAPAGPPSAMPAPTGANPVGPPAGRPGTRAPIRQRIPGANLPAAPPAAPAGPLIGDPADPSSARALVEAFQDGVRRAESDVDQAPPGTEPPQLSRRVPGANLSVSPAQSMSPTSADLGDPGEVRDLITEFEAGVARALREVSPARRHEEDPTR